MVTRSKYRTSYPTIVEDVKRIPCSDKLPERVRLVVLLSGLAQFVPHKIKNSNNGVNAEKIIAGKDAI